MSFPRTCAALAAACAWGALAAGQAPVPRDQFEALHALIKPQPGESKWARVPWLTNLEEARRRAVAEDRPLFLWRSGGGDVLGRT
jgi:hypothetical protein